MDSDSQQVPSKETIPSSSTNVDSNPTPTSTQGDNVAETVEEVPPLVLGRQRKFKSEVWNHFTIEVVDGKTKAKCKYCQKLLGGESRNGTKHLKDHFSTCLKRKCRNVVDDLKQKKLKMDEVGSDKGKLMYVSFDQEVTRKELSHMVIMHEYPLCIVEHIGFRRYSASLQPAFTMIFRNTLRNDILKVYDYEKAKTMLLLKNNQSRVAITTDMWTAQNQKRGFIAITAHWIDDSWILQSRILRFAYVPCPHTAEALGDELMACFMDWNLDRKLVTLTVDNCSCNDAIIDILLGKLKRSLILRGEFFHMRCCAHILNLIVKDGLDVIGDAIEKIRDSVAFWRATPKREERFKEICEQDGLQYSKKLILDCRTRWNSTFLMLETAILYKDVFPRLHQRDSSYKCLPSDDDWEMAKDICSRLCLFYSVTELFSGSRYPTANLYFPKVFDIRLSLSEWILDSNDVIRSMAKRMMEKFDKYWSSINGIMGVAAVLDPRYKLVSLECYFQVMYGGDAYDEVERIKNVCYDLFHEYEQKIKQKSGGGTSGGSGSFNSLGSLSTSSTAGSTKSKFEMIYDQYVANMKKTITSIKSELDIYLEDDVMPRTDNFDILSWWRNEMGKYPILSTMARDIYAIPISTVASESAFSVGGRFLSPHRNRLHPKTLEALMCTRDWLWAAIEMEDSTASSIYHRSTFEDESSLYEEL